MYITMYSTEFCQECKATKMWLPYIKDKFPEIEWKEVDPTSKENHHLIDKLGLSKVPTIVSYREDGTEIHRIIGRASKTSLEVFIEESLAKDKNKV